MSRKILEHPIVPILLGWWVGADGPGDIHKRSYALLALFIWFSWSVWQGLSRSENRWHLRNRNFIFSISFTIVAVLMMWLMMTMLQSVLDAQQGDVFNNLQAKIDLPASEINLDSTFTITNNSHNEIGAHALFCQVIKGIAQHTDMENTSAVVGPESDEPLEPGGDAQSESCLNGPSIKYIVGPDPLLACMDALIGIQYSLTSQPKIIKQKAFRFVSEIGKDYRWYPEPLSMKQSPCTNPRFAHPPAL
jgi:hypothetical protein